MYLWEVLLQEIAILRLTCSTGAGWLAGRVVCERVPKP